MATQSITDLDRALFDCTDDVWPVIADAKGDNGGTDVPVTAFWRVVVRQHADGRRIVYSYQRSVDEGPVLTRNNVEGFREVRCGFLIDTKPPMTKRDLEDETVRAVRYALKTIDKDWFAGECIGRLPTITLD
jgi:hypothetical protein